MPEQWITKEEAGNRLGVPGRPLSARRVQELAKAERLDSTLQRDITTGHLQLRISAGSVERFVFERDNPTPKTRAVRAPGKTPMPRAVRATANDRNPIAEYLAQLAPPVGARPAAAAGGLWLTLKDAAEYSGLPAPVLVTLIKSGEIRAIDCGRRRGGKWRISRPGLDQFAKGGIDNGENRVHRAIEVPA